MPEGYEDEKKVIAQVGNLIEQYEEMDGHAVVAGCVLEFHRITENTSRRYEWNGERFIQTPGKDEICQKQTS